MTNPKDQLSARLSKAKTELEEALVEIEKFPVFEAGTVAFGAHALNNFLTVTVATIELLQLHLRDFANSEVQTLLVGLQHTADLMNYTVSRLMNSAARGGTQLVSREVDLVTLAQRARDYYQRMADRKQIEVIAESTTPSALVWTDGVAVAAVLDNLLSNAVKYSPTGKKVWLRVAVEPNSVTCSVRDEGPGLSPEDQARLFKKGVRLSAVPTGGETSTGYGLAVAKELINRLGGAIWCDSSLGDGACFSFRLPASHPTEGSAAKQT